MTVWMAQIDGSITSMPSSHNSQSYIFTFSFTFAMRVANIPISWAWRSISVGKIKEHRTLREGWAVSAFKI